MTLREIGLTIRRLHSCDLERTRLSRGQAFASGLAQSSLINSNGRAISFLFILTLPAQSLFTRMGERRDFTRTWPTIRQSRNMKVSASADHLVYADALRATAILLVVMNHIMWWAHPVVGHRPLTFGYFGVWGVNCFFVLSGFLLGRSYLNALIDNRTFPSTKLYLFRRLLRIYPLYFVSVVASIIATILFLHVRPTFVDAIYHFFLLQSLSTVTVISLNGPLWTMGIDAAFYLALPVGAFALLPLMRKRARGERIATIAWCLAGICLACLVFRYFAYGYHRMALYDFPTAAVFARNPIGFAFSFMMGIGVALLSLARVTVSRAVAIAIGCTGIVIAIVEFAARLEAGGEPVPRTFIRLSLLDPIAAISSACVLFSVAQLGSKRLLHFASTKSVAIFASLAYAVYLFHWLVIEALDTRWLKGAVGNIALVKLTLATFLIILPIAYVLNRFIEKPFLALKDRQRGGDALATPAKDGAQQLPATTH